MCGMLRESAEHSRHNGRQRKYNVHGIMNKWTRASIMEGMRPFYTARGVLHVNVGQHTHACPLNLRFHIWTLTSEWAWDIYPNNFVVGNTKLLVARYSYLHWGLYSYLWYMLPVQDTSTSSIWITTAIADTRRSMEIHLFRFHHWPSIFKGFWCNSYSGRQIHKDGTLIRQWHAIMESTKLWSW